VKLNGEVIGEKSIELMDNETWERPSSMGGCKGIKNKE